MLIKRITFEEILPVWKEQLWPNRKSAIETHSAMVWPFSTSKLEYDISIFEYPANYFGAYSDNTLIGVNSGHATSDSQYRSRGLWVNPNYRGQRIAQGLLTLTFSQALSENKKMMWTVPRKTALSAYKSFGFSTVGQFFETETADENIYAMMKL